MHYFLLELIIRKKILELINVIEKYIKLDNENDFYDKNMKEIVNDLVQQKYKKIQM